MKKDAVDWPKKEGSPDFDGTIRELRQWKERIRADSRKSRLNCPLHSVEPKKKKAQIFRSTPHYLIFAQIGLHFIDGASVISEPICETSHFDWKLETKIG